MTSPTIALCALVGYFLTLLIIARLTGKDADNETFFRGNKKSPWPVVAFGMIGASLSGVSFVSVPGYVGHTHMTYLQMCIGFFFGYLAVAFILLPIYYRMNLTSIYSYLQDRFGTTSRQTGAAFFILSKLAGAAVRFYLVCMVLQQIVFEPFGIPYPLTVIIILLLVWLYTRRAGIRTLVYTDALQTFCLIGAIIAVVTIISRQMYPSWQSMAQAVSQSPLSRIFVWDDWTSRQYFWKQFLSGIFIVIVMTGLDQDMMQKNLTCPTLRKAQKDMCSYGICFVPVNLLLLLIGVLLYTYAGQNNIAIPADGDQLFPMLVLDGHFGHAVTVLFTLGISAAAFSSIDSALTALTTTFCVDILNIDKTPSSPKAVNRRKAVHLGITISFILLTVLFRLVGNGSVIDMIYVLASYTYGPLLGLFAFGIFTHHKLKERYAPFIAIASPLVCYALSVIVPHYTGYHFGYELLMLNGTLTFLLLYAVRTHPRMPLKTSSNNQPT